MVGGPDGELRGTERDGVRADAHRVEDDGRLDRRRAAPGLEPVAEPRERRTLADPLVVIGDQRETREGAARRFGRARRAARR